MTLRDPTSGTPLSTWTSDPIPGSAETQVPITTVESNLGASVVKPSFYVIDVNSTFAGYFQHVLWRPSDGTLTNLSTCGSATKVDTAVLSAIHSTLLSAQYPSTLVVKSTGSTAQTVVLGIYNATTGVKIGTYTTASIPAYAQLQVTALAIETQMGHPATTGPYHYVVQVEGTFSGFLQNLVNNTQVGVTTDMSAACTLGG